MGLGRRVLRLFEGRKLCEKLRSTKGIRGGGGQTSIQDHTWGRNKREKVLGRATGFYQQGGCSLTPDLGGKKGRWGGEVDTDSIRYLMLFAQTPTKKVALEKSKVGGKKGGWRRRTLWDTDRPNIWYGRTARGKNES